MIVIAAWSVTAARAASPVKLQNAIIMVDPEAALSPLTIEGTVSHLGKVAGDGEISFEPGEEGGSSYGEGVVVLVAANGDQLVGIITLDIYPLEDGEHDVDIHISWSDSVEFSDGSVFASTGRFAKTRPPGIIARAIGTREWITQPLCIVTR
jgi:hypothetical protein